MYKTKLLTKVVISYLVKNLATKLAANIISSLAKIQRKIISNFFSSKISKNALAKNPIKNNQKSSTVKPNIWYGHDLLCSIFCDNVTLKGGDNV